MDVDTAELLTEEDLSFLEEKGWKFSVAVVGGETHVLFEGFLLGEAYQPTRADLLIRLPAGYPNANPDMYWTRQDVRLKATGAFPQASAHHEVPGTGKGAEIYGNTPWQRWSRHFKKGWRPGVDGLRSFMTAVVADLAKGR